MVSALFQSEISNLESQVAQLQARIAALGECESEADGMLQVVQKTLGKISALAPDAIATLKMAVFNLFNDGNQGGQMVNTAGGPTGVFRCSPEKSDPLLNGESCAVDPDAHWQVAAPDGSSWEWATPIACQLEDCPAESLRGQVYELCCPITQNVTAIYESVSLKSMSTTLEEAISIDGKPSDDNGAEKSLFELVDLNGTVAYMKRVSDGQIAAVYIGFNNKTKAKAWADWLSVIHSVATKAEVRVAKRLSIFKYEIKASGVSFKSIEKLTGCDFNLDPRKALPDAPKRLPERVPSHIEIENIGIGDVVRSVTVKTWHYKVVEVNADGFYVCERLNTNPTIVQTLHPGSVELVRKADVVDTASQELAEHLEKQVQDAIESIQPLLHAPAKIDVDDVPAGIRLTPGRDDLLVQYEVWLTAEVRVMGRSQVQQRQIGLLTETSLGIEALRPRASVGKHFGRTLDAVAFLIACSGLKPVTVKSEPALVGATAAIDDDEF